MLPLCHRVLDPIAADDLDAFVAVLGEGVVLTRTTHQAGAQRLTGPSAVQEKVAEAGGLRALLHARASDRVVGTVANDCRGCRQGFVAFEANTRSGTTVVRVDLGQPAMVTAVEVGSNLRRGPLLQTELVSPKAEPSTRRSDEGEDETSPTLKTAPAKKKKGETSPTLAAPKE